MQKAQELINQLLDIYSNEGVHEPKVTINGFELTKYQLVDILSVLNVNCTTDREGVSVVSDEALTYACDENGNVYLSNGKYFDSDTMEAYMDGLGMNKLKLSKKAGVTYVTINNICKGVTKYANPRTNKKISEVLGFKDNSKN